jgi:hypothetical protein
MQIVVVIPVDIPPFAAAFPDRAEGDFPQASQLAQQRRVLLAVALPEVNHFAIGGAAQAFGLVQFAFEQRPVFRTGDGAFGFELPRQPFAQLFKVLIAAAGKLASAGLGIEPARPGICWPMRTGRLLLRRRNICCISRSSGRLSETSVLA